MLKHHVVANYPILEQNQIAADLVNSATEQPLFTLQFFNTVTYKNAKQKPKLNETFLRVDPKNPAHVIYTFTPTTSDPYYLTLGSNLEKKCGSGLIKRSHATTIRYFPRYCRLKPDK